MEDSTHGCVGEQLANMSRPRDASKGWKILLSRAMLNRAAPTQSGGKSSSKSNFRSCSWLREHDPSSINDLLDSALRAPDKKTQLAAAGTLLAVTDTLEQNCRSLSAEESQPLPQHCSVAPTRLKASSSLDTQTGESASPGSQNAAENVPTPISHVGLRAHRRDAEVQSPAAAAARAMPHRDADGTDTAARRREQQPLITEIREDSHDKHRQRQQQQQQRQESEAIALSDGTSSTRGGPSRHANAKGSSLKGLPARVVDREREGGAHPNISPAVATPMALPATTAPVRAQEELEDLAITLTQRFVPLLTAVAFGDAVQRTSSSAHGANNGNSDGVSHPSSSSPSSSTAVTLAPAVPGPCGPTWSRGRSENLTTPGQPPPSATALTCYAAESALALTRVCSMVLASTAVAGSVGTTKKASRIRQAGSSGRGEESSAKTGDSTGHREAGVNDVGAMPVGGSAVASARNDTWSVEGSDAILEHGPGTGNLVSHPRPPRRSANGDGASLSPLRQSSASDSVKSDLCVADAQDGRSQRRHWALQVLAELSPVSTVPLLMLAEVWLVGTTLPTEDSGGRSSGRSVGRAYNGSSSVRGAGQGGGEQGASSTGFEDGKSRPVPVGEHAQKCCHCRPCRSQSHLEDEDEASTWKELPRRNGPDLARGSALLKESSSFGASGSDRYSDQSLGIPLRAVVEEGEITKEGLAARALRDLTALLTCAVDVRYSVEKRAAEIRRLRERDGSDASLQRNAAETVAKDLTLCDEITAHTSWHVANTIPSILGSRRWPTSQLKGRGGESRGSRSATVSLKLLELMELIGELEACDPRVVEMAGMEPPPGLEEGRWLTLRKLCLCLSGLRNTRDLFRSSSGGQVGVSRGTAHASMSLGRQSRELSGGKEGSNGSGEQGTGESPARKLHEVLIRALGSAEPDAQKLAAAALVWLMAATLKEREREGVDGSGMAVHVTPLLGLMGEGDAAAAAASSILVGLALERPALVIPEVLQAVNSGAVPNASLQSPSAVAVRLHVTRVLSDIVRSTKSGRRGGGEYLRQSRVCTFLLEAIGDHLVEMVMKGELEVRTAAARGLVPTDPGWAIPRLCQSVRAQQKMQREEAACLEAGRTKGSSKDVNGVGGCGWDSNSRSAAFQVIGDMIVHGEDPADALCSLLDSLRYPSPLSEEAPEANEIPGAGGRSETSSSSGAKIDEKRFEDRALAALPLWTRRLKARSDSSLNSFRKDEPRCSRCRAAEGSADADAAEASLFGACLEAAAIKALAAPEDPLPVRFFAVIAASASARASSESVDPAHTAMNATPLGGGIPAASTSLRPSEPLRVASNTFGAMIEIVRARMRGQLRLTEALLAEETDLATETVRTLLFSRLAPLLLLKALPAASLATEYEQERSRKLPLGQDASQQRHPQQQEGCLPPSEDEELHAERGERPGEGAHDRPSATKHSALEENSQDSLEACGSGTRGRESELANGVPVKDMGHTSSPTKHLPDMSDSVADATLSRAPRTADHDLEGTDEGYVEGLEGCLEEMHGLLWERLSRVYEYDQVQKLAAEVSGKLPPRLVIPGAVARLNAYAGMIEDDDEPGIINTPIENGDDAVVSPGVIATRVLFTACHAVTNHGESIEPWLALLLQGIVRVMALPVKKRVEEVSRVQLGAINCLALILESCAHAGRIDSDSNASAISSARREAVATPSLRRHTKASTRGEHDPPLVSIGDVPDFVARLAVEGVMKMPWECVDSERTSEKHTQLRMCVANAAVTAARRCPPELLPTLCRQGNLLDHFLNGASRGSGLLRAACLQAVFALVYRTQGTFTITGVRCTCDDVMQVACDALDQEQAEEVRVSGLKLLLGVVAAGSSPSGQKVSTNGTRDKHAAFNKENGSTNVDGRSSSGTTVVRESVGPDLHVGGKSNKARLIGNSDTVQKIIGTGNTGNDQQRSRAGDGNGVGNFRLKEAAAGEDRSIMSPSTVSRAKRLLRGVANVDTSSEARKLAAEALSAFGGLST